MPPENTSGKKPEPIIFSILNDTPIVFIIVLLVVAIFGVLFGGIGGYGDITGWFHSESWKKINLTLGLIFSFLSLGLMVFIGVVIQKHANLKKKYLTKKEVTTHEVLPKTEVKESWNHIRELANSRNPSDWNMAILRADALLDDILQHIGYQGATLAERLKIVDPTKLLSLERIWSAHRLRNMIAHDPLEQHTKETIVHALRSYEQALKELGMMSNE